MSPADDLQFQQPHIPSLAIYRHIATIFILLTLAVVGSVLYFAYSKATIVVLSEQKEVREDFIIDVSKKPGAGEVAGGVYELSDVAAEEFPATSFAKADAHATGRVKITSVLARPQTLVATTRLLSADGVLFRLKDTVTVPASGSVEAEIFADAAGALGDVGTTTFTIPGLYPNLQKLFTVETLEPISGGTKEVRMVTEEDLSAAIRMLKERLSSELGEKLRAKVKEDGVNDSGAIVAVDVVRQIADKEVGEEAESFRVSLTVRVTAVFYDQQAFDAQVVAELKDALPEGRALQSVTVDDRQTAVEKRDVVGGRANIHVFARGIAVISPEAPALDRAKLVGITVDAATLYLQKTDGISSASVKVSPFWSRRLPSDPARLKIEIR